MARDVPWGAGPVVAPSILSADFAHLARDIDRVPEAPLLHLDVMDGHFVDNLTFGPALVAAVRRHTDRFLDCHLMIEEPLRYVKAFAEAGADAVSIHAELFGDLVPALKRLRELDVRCGVAINPDTPLERVAPVLDRLDLLVVMSVFPGFGGQSFREEALPKMEAARRLRAERGLSFGIEIDGGVSAANAERVTAAGADVLVAGSAVFGAPDPAEAVRAIGAFLH